MPAAMSQETNGLVLALFPGIDLLGRAFEAEGFCIVRGPDPLFGGDIREFRPPLGVFAGVIGGSPCQDFSALRRDEPTGLGVEMLWEFIRCIERCRPAWFVLENVPRVPDVAPDGYHVQRLNLTARDCGLSQLRNRCFQFGSLDGIGLVIPRASTTAAQSQPAATASEGESSSRRTWAEFCELQGLPATFTLPGLTKTASYRAVGNGVPIPMGRAIARAVQTRHYTQAVTVCVCDCGRPVTGKQTAATAACRKRMERRRRDGSNVTEPGPVTAAVSQTDDVAEERRDVRYAHYEAFGFPD